MDTILIIALVIYGMISASFATFITIYTQIGSVFYDVDRLTYVLIFLGTLLFWPLILLVVFIQWISLKIRGE